MTEKRLIKRCHNCAREGQDMLCKHGNIERILRLEKHEECPFWMPKSNPNNEFIRRIQRKFERVYGTELKPDDHEKTEAENIKREKQHENC